MANEAMETLLQKMTDLTTAIKGKEKQELQWDEVQAQFGEQLKGLVAAQVKEKMDAQLAYRTVGAEVGGNGQFSQVKAGNRWSHGEKLAKGWRASHRQSKSQAC